MQRILVCSDIHDREDVLEAIVHHADYVRGRDRLIIAGDLSETDEVEGRVHRLATSLGAELLLGNHEAWFLNDVGDSDEAETVATGMLEGRWKLAEEVDGILITHAGVASTFAGRHRIGDLPAHEVAGWLNRQAIQLAQVQREGWSLEDDVLLDVADGPVWYRPALHHRPVGGFLQVAGHTVPGHYTPWRLVEELEQEGYAMIDPGVRYYTDRERVHIRYAVIEAGEVRVVDAFA